MDFQIKNNRIILWDNDKCIATITINYIKKRFSINISGLCNDGLTFYNSNGIRKYLKQSCVLKIDIPDKVYEYIDSIAVMFILT